MKVTYVEQIEQKFTLSKKMCCTVCGSHRYEIVKQLTLIVPVAVATVLQLTSAYFHLLFVPSQ